MASSTIKITPALDSKLPKQEKNMHHTTAHNTTHMPMYQRQQVATTINELQKYSHN